MKQSRTHFELRADGKGYDLPKVLGPHSHHGGVRGLSRVLWKGHVLPSLDAVRFEHTSPAGAEGYPGTLRCAVTYILRRLPTGGSAFAVHIEAQTDAATPVNLTSHIYWNLNGERTRNTVHNHKLQVNADRFVETGDYSIPTGRLPAVDNTDLDYRCVTSHVALINNRISVVLSTNTMYEQTSIVLVYEYTLQFMTFCLIGVLYLKRSSSKPLSKLLSCDSLKMITKPSTLIKLSKPSFMLMLCTQYGNVD